MELDSTTHLSDTYTSLPPEAIEMRNLVWKRYDEARDTMNEFAGTPHAQKFTYKMMAIRDTLGLIDELMCGLGQPATNLTPGKYMDPAMFNERFARK